MRERALLRIGIGGWAVWELPRWLSGFVVAVVAAYVAVIGVAVAFTTVRIRDVGLWAILIILSIASIELTRGPGDEPAGLVKYVYGAWQLPIAILLPPLYGLIAPIPNLAFIHWRVRRTLIHRRLLTTAALGLSYGAASVAYHWIAAQAGLSPGPGLRWLPWVLVVAACGLLQWATNNSLVMTAVKGSDRSARLRSLLFGREQLFNDAAELNTSIVLAVMTSIAWFLAVLALPFVVLLHRSYRHAQLVNESRIDGKTGLLNAVTWQREATREIMRAVRTRSPLAVAIADIDHFKAVNDTYGHLTGDAVLAGIARAMTALLRDYDIIGRFGGEEFVILLPQTTADEVRSIAERLREKLAEIIIPVDMGTAPESPLRVTVSIGIATLDGSRRDVDDMLAAADAALYEAKNAGRNRVCVLADGAPGR
ncbi:MAG TPA: GGDEF domain-containing protein [Streptosporangiaceae bacterium]|nr:GGDEF domain-containing protein [Streptosporangiaceae bacterium]